MNGKYFRNDETGGLKHIPAEKGADGLNKKGVLTLLEMYDEDMLDRREVLLSITVPRGKVKVGRAYLKDEETAEKYVSVMTGFGLDVLKEEKGERPKVYFFNSENLSAEELKKALTEEGFGTAEKLFGWSEESVRSFEDSLSFLNLLKKFVSGVSFLDLNYLEVKHVTEWVLESSKEMGFSENDLKAVALLNNYPVPFDLNMIKRARKEAVEKIGFVRDLESIFDIEILDRIGFYDEWEWLETGEH